MLRAFLTLGGNSTTVCVLFREIEWRDKCLQAAQRSSTFSRPAAEIFVVLWVVRRISNPDPSICSCGTDWGSELYLEHGVFEYREGKLCTYMLLFEQRKEIDRGYAFFSCPNAYLRCCMRHLMLYWMVTKRGSLDDHIDDMSNELSQIKNRVSFNIFFVLSVWHIRLPM
jgi:hypothetical protein